MRLQSPYKADKDCTVYEKDKKLLCTCIRNQVVGQARSFKTPLVRAL